VGEVSESLQLVSAPLPIAKVVNSYCILYARRLMSVSSVSHAHFVERTRVRVLVFQVEHLLFVVETSIVVAEFSLVEGLWLVVTESVGRADLVGVLIALSAPAGTIPVLAVHSVTGAKLLKGVLFEVVVLESCAGGVAMLGHILGEVKILRIVKDHAGVTIAEVAMGVHVRLVEAGPGRRVVVVAGVVCWVREMPGLGAESAASSLTSGIVGRNQSGIESSCREHILLLI